MSACDVRHAYFSRGLHKVRSREHVVTYPQVSISSSHTGSGTHVSGHACDCIQSHLRHFDPCNSSRCPADFFLLSRVLPTVCPLLLGYLSSPVAILCAVVFHVSWFSFSPELLVPCNFCTQNRPAASPQFVSVSCSTDEETVNWSRPPHLDLPLWQLPSGLCHPQCTWIGAALCCVVTVATVIWF